MHSFINKNQYSEKLSISYGTITQKLCVERYIEKNKFDEDIRAVGWSKLAILARNSIHDKEKVAELSKYSIAEMTSRITNRSSASGKYIRKSFNPRKGSEIITKDFEIPFAKRKAFINSLKQLCELYKVEII